MIHALTETSPLLRKWLYRLRPPTEEDWGKPGREFYQLQAAGFSVAPTWVLGADTFDLAVNQAGLAGSLAEMRWSLGGLWNDLPAAERVLQALEPQRVDAARRLRQVAPLTRLDLDRLLQVPAATWTVRPSPTTALDGVFPPPTCVPPTRWELWDAVRQVWSWTVSRSVLACCAQHDVPLPRMAVVLQPMQPLSAADRSGVIASQSPQPATFPGVMIRVTFGLWTGRNDGICYSVEGDAVKFRRQERKKPIHVTGPDGERIETAAADNPAPLSGSEAIELAQMATAVAKQWHRPVNLEFVWRMGAEPVLTWVESGTGHAVQVEPATNDH